MKLSWLTNELNIIQKMYGDLDLEVLNHNRTAILLLTGIGVFKDKVVIDVARPGIDVCTICHSGIGRCECVFKVGGNPCIA